MASSSEIDTGRNNLKDLVTIVIPTYKRGDRLGVAIQSILDQDYPNIEVIVVDDNDPEGNDRSITEGVMNTFFKDERIKYIKHEKNLGGAAARNTGIFNSKGKYIGFLDDDDIFLQEKISLQVDFLSKNPEFDANYCGSILNGKLIRPTLKGSLGKELLEFQTSMFTPTLFFRRHVLIELSGFDESFKRHQDYDLLIRFFRAGYRIGVISKPLVEIGTNQGENALRGRDLEQLKREFLTKFHPFLLELDEQQNGVLASVYSKNFARVVIDYFVRGNFKDGMKLFTEFFGLYKRKFLLILLSILIKLTKRKIFR